MSVNNYVTSKFLMKIIGTLVIAVTAVSGTLFAMTDKVDDKVEAIEATVAKDVITVKLEGAERQTQISVLETNLETIKTDIQELKDGQQQVIKILTSGKSK